MTAVSWKKIMMFFGDDTRLAQCQHISLLGTGSRDLQQVASFGRLSATVSRPYAWWLKSSPYQYLYGILWLSFCVELWFWVLSKLVIGFSIFVSSSVIMRFFFNRFDTLQLWCSIAYFGRKSLLCYYPVFH